MDRIAWCRAAVKDSSSAVTGPLSCRRRRARAAAAAVQGRGGAGADELGGGQPGPGFLDDQPWGAGPQDRAGGAVPGAGDGGLVFAERGLRRAPPGEIGVPDLRRAGAASWSRRVVITVQVSETLLSRRRRAGSRCARRRGPGAGPASFPDGAFSQVMRDPSGSQPRSGPSQRQADAFFHPGDDVPARVQDRRDQRHGRVGWAARRGPVSALRGYGPFPCSLPPNPACTFQRTGLSSDLCRVRDGGRVDVIVARRADDERLAPHFRHECCPRGLSRSGRAEVREPGDLMGGHRGSVLA